MSTPEEKLNVCAADASCDSGELTRRSRDYRSEERRRFKVWLRLLFLPML